MQNVVVRAVFASTSGSGFGFGCVQDGPRHQKNAVLLTYSCTKVFANSECPMIRIKMLGYFNDEGTVTDGGFIGCA